MKVLLADVTDVPDPGGLLDRLEGFRVPTHEEFVHSLAALEPIWACVLLGCGLVYLLQGWKMFKILVVLNAAILGVLLGSRLAAVVGGDRNMPLFAGIGGGLILAVLAWPLMKYAISIMGGLVGSFVGFGMWNYAAQVVGKPSLLEYAWVGALIGLITLGLLAFVIFRFVVITFTCFQGSLMTVSGILGLLLKYDRVAEPLTNSLTLNVHMLPLLVGIPAVIGFVFQNSALAKKAKKKRKAAEGES